MPLNRSVTVLLGDSGCVSIYMEKQSGISRAVMKVCKKFLWSGEECCWKNFVLWVWKDRLMHPDSAGVTVFVLGDLRWFVLKLFHSSSGMKPGDSLNAEWHYMVFEERNWGKTPYLCEVFGKIFLKNYQVRNEVTIHILQGLKPILCGDSSSFPIIWK